MKNLLIISYYFPPSGGPGVQRVLKITKYLQEFGWKPHILTVSNGQYPARDESLAAEIPEGTPVFRTKIYEPYDLYRLLTGKRGNNAIDVNVIKRDDDKLAWKDRIAELIRATLFIPDARIGWMITARKEVLRIIDEYKIDAIYSSSPPYTCSLIGRYAKRKRNLPWVAGFRDPWTGFISSPKRWFLPSAIDKAMEKSVFMESDLVECAWLGIIKDAFAKYPDLDASKFVHVPNGYDSKDFPAVHYIPTEKFTVTYTGTMYARRNPESFFSALELLIQRNQIDKDKLHIRFVGRFGNEIVEMFRNASFHDSIEEVGYVTHNESIEYLIRSDALLLVVDESKESEEIVPGKVYEYVGVNRPIIAIAPVKSAIADLMAETGSGLIAHQSEIEKIADIILKYYHNWQSGNTEFKPNGAIVKSYERRQATGKLAEYLNKLTK